MHLHKPPQSIESPLVGKERQRQRVKAMQDRTARAAQMKLIKFQDEKIEAVIPWWCRKLAAYCPPRWLVAVGNFLVWLIMAPGRLLGRIVHWLWFTPWKLMYGWLWTFGCTTKMTPIPGYNWHVVRVRLWYWFRLRGDWMYNTKIDLVKEYKAVKPMEPREAEKEGAA